MGVSLLKKYQLFKEYRNIIKQTIKKFPGEQNTLNLNCDKIYRLWTVINMPEDVKVYGTELSNEFIKKYLKDANKYFNEINLNELVAIAKVERVGPSSYLVVFSFSLFNVERIANNIRNSVVTLLGGSLLYTIYHIFFG